MSFDSRGRGAAPSEWCRVLVVARYWCGAHGRFDAQLGRLLPAPAAVEGPRGVLPPVVAAPTPGLRATPGGVARPLLKNEADPVYDLLGPGRVSHPQEWNETITRLEREGVEISYREGVMAYWAKEGEPGRIIIDLNCSIAALRHETKHFLDDKALGYPGMGYFFENQNARWQLGGVYHQSQVKAARRQQVAT